MTTASLEDFYKQVAAGAGDAPGHLLPHGITREIGHFNVFRIDELMARSGGKPAMPYNRRAYYKISLIIGRNRVEYADKVIGIEKSALLFAGGAFFKFL
jgi:AraC family transcriptional regulator, transcriptional activator of pobA